MSDICIAAQSFSRMADAQLVYTVLYCTVTRRALLIALSQLVSQASKATNEKQTDKT